MSRDTITKTETQHLRQALKRDGLFRNEDLFPASSSMEKALNVRFLLY